MPIEGTCTPIDYRRITRWAREAILEAMQRRLDRKTGTYRRRDELARPCLQPQATDQFAWHSEDDQSNEVTRRLTGGLTACRSRSRRSIIERETSLPSSTPATTAFPHSLGRSRPVKRRIRRYLLHQIMAFTNWRRSPPCVGFYDAARFTSPGESAVAGSPYSDLNSRPEGSGTSRTALSRLPPLPPLFSTPVAAAARVAAVCVQPAAGGGGARSLRRRRRW